MIIMACGLTRAARPTATTLIAKKTATSAVPSTAPSSPLPPATASADDDHDRGGGGRRHDRPADDPGVVRQHLEDSGGLGGDLTDLRR